MGQSGDTMHKAIELGKKKTTNTRNREKRLSYSQKHDDYTTQGYFKHETMAL
jgi:hypothetical protein